MGGSRGKQQGHALQRQLTLILQLMQQPRGMTLLEIQQVMVLPKPTFHRYVKAIREAGVEIESTLVTGQARYSVPTQVWQALAVSPEQLDALRVARRRVAGLEGTHVTSALDALIRTGARKQVTHAGWVRTRKGRVNVPDHLHEIERAFSSGRRVVIRYRGERDTAARLRKLDPLLVRYVGEHVYFHAFDVDQQALRTFKVDRIKHVEVTRERAGSHSIDEQAFARSVKTWLGEPVTITVRLSPRVARIADEYRIVEDQVLTDEPDGGARITATVNGIPEAMRWILSWGQDAEALEPKSLRDAVAAQVTTAAAHYIGARLIAPTAIAPTATAPTKVAAKKTRARRSPSLTDRETAAE